jgi:hypothetical protein
MRENQARAGRLARVKVCRGSFEFLVSGFQKLETQNWKLYL